MGLEKEEMKSEGISGLDDRVAQLEKQFSGKDDEGPRSLQERIIALEKKIADLKVTDDRNGKSQITENTVPRSVTAQVRKTSWSDFKNWYNEDDARYAIEALYVGTDLSDEIRIERQRRRRSTMLPPEGSSKQISGQELSRRWLYRIRIQSHAVLLILSKHLNRAWDDEIRTFIRPFRPLIALHEEMKRSLAELEHKWAHQEKAESMAEGESPRNITSASSGVDPKGLADESNERLFIVEDCVAALREMRCYVQFMEENVVPIRSRLASNPADNPPKIRWDDLWCLFEPGQYVYTATEPRKGQPNSRQPDQARTQKVRKLLSAVAPGMRLKTPGGRRVKRKKSDDSDNETDEEEDENSEDWFICETDPEPSKGDYVMALWCYYIDYDGQAFRPVYERIDIDYFHGEKEVNSLTVYPLKFAREEKQILDQFCSRGESFKKYVQSRRSYYNGRSIDDKIDARHYEGEVIIDFEEALVHHPEWTPPWLSWIQYPLEFPVTQDDFPIRKWISSGGKPVALEVSEVLQKDYGIEMMDYSNAINRDEFLATWKEWDKARSQTEPPGIDIVDSVLLPQRLLGYVLRERKFCQLDVRFLRPLRKKMGFDDLKIIPESKTLIQSLVDSHFQNKEAERVGDVKIGQDIIEGKANNLIILLHGVPGVGKTATAEAVADANEKPLFPITCGDLGLEPEKVETKLGSIFQLANKWNCVLLLDEADIFLADRKPDNLERNALVSVFLRILEYYNGILILTTNRVGTIDEAFESRIHIMLYYPRLTEDQTKDIFKMNIDRLKDIENQKKVTTGQPAIEIDEEKIIRFAKSHFRENRNARWNGRQIRNAFQIASSMARYDWSLEKSKTPVLDGKYFERVASATREFHSYLKEARGKDNSALAHEHSERADDFDIGPVYPDHYSPPKTRRPNRYSAESHGSQDYHRGGGHPRHNVDERDPRHNRSHRPAYSPRRSPDRSPRGERRTKLSVNSLLAGPANLRALYNDSASHAKGVPPVLDTQSGSNEPTFYGIDRGLHDHDLGKNDDMNAIGGSSPLLQRESLDTPLDEPTDYSWNEFGFGIDAGDAEKADGGYYSKPVSILIPQNLEPLPDRLVENPMNLLYFHHFITNTARALVPYDDPHANPFRTILPQMAVKNDSLLALLLAYSGAFIVFLSNCDRYA
ncbi:hypothetical protein NUW58_g2732 [Xylaria curta]|uniref:Uncharacterized protein n=1 Tax=Xylaria curta TaxID=42375 RepID=A0ACC1PFC4_9PEZI|nr:hypothetical protein NUW58_g2732 [Xylaria curta]